MKILTILFIITLSTKGYSADTFCLNYVGECHSNIIKNDSWLKKVYEQDGVITYADVYSQTVSFVYRATITGEKAYCEELKNEKFKDNGFSKWGPVWHVAYSNVECKKKFKKFEILDRAYMQDFESVSENGVEAFEDASVKCEYYRNLLLDSVVEC